MAFSYNGWTLYTRDVVLTGGKNQKIYFFSKKVPKGCKPCDKPDGWRVKESKNKGSGMPYLTKH